MKIIGDNGYISLEIMYRENPAALDQDDAGWLRSSIEVEAGPFRGRFEFSMTQAETKVLHQQLMLAIQSLREEVRFRNMEENLELVIRFETSGTAEVCGEIRPPRMQGNVLCYSFRTDPISLERATAELGDALGQLPALHS